MDGSIRFQQNEMKRQDLNPGLSFSGPYDDFVPQFVKPLRSAVEPDRSFPKVGLHLRVCGGRQLLREREGEELFDQQG